MTVTRKDLAYYLADTLGFTVTEARTIVDLFFDQIRQTLAQGEEVKLSGFGNFVLRDKRARPGRNPKTKVPVEITARRVVTFHASQSLKGHCNPPPPPAEEVPPVPVQSHRSR
ncbi:integration host factor subunit A-like protein (plasmid) [Acidithiobacillus caldus SM-1]|uniref:Integration host factor subunit alpha n=1 Tax=Acidithiobacillus caldus (strain SM-1) TaxID=990288 RepID=F9ZUV9_ACICS|nr:integration host factor subunit alpha [Acidithiobacillus caldus]AEK59799.1 integration host factor subunit A-like protein [Acidithiobacillus caldus SM-1]